jgi:hypothetical protein
MIETEVSNGRQRPERAMIRYLGCVLFGLAFLVLSAKSSGALGAKMDATFDWIQDWAPFSYIILLAVVVAPVASLMIMRSWPEHKEPEDPMAKYKHGEDVLED